MTQAIFTLLAVIVGAAITFGSTWFLEWRRERGAQRAALHVIEAQLLRARSFIESTIKDGYWTATLDPSIRSWARYEDVLARGLRRDDFHFGRRRDFRRPSADTVCRADRALIN